MIKTMTREEYNKAIGLNDSSNAVTSTVGKMQTMTREEYNAAIGIKKDTYDTGSSGRLQTMTRKEYDSAIKKYGTASEKKASVSDNMFVYLDKRNAVRSNMQMSKNSSVGTSSAVERNPLLDVKTGAMERDISKLEDRLKSARKANKAKSKTEIIDSLLPGSSDFRKDSVKTNEKLANQSQEIPDFRTVKQPVSSSEIPDFRTDISKKVTKQTTSKSIPSGITDITHSQLLEKANLENNFSDSENISELEKKLAQKKAYLNQAKIAQQWQRLTDDALSDDTFANKSIYKSTKKNESDFTEAEYEYINNIDDAQKTIDYISMATSNDYSDYKKSNYDQLYDKEKGIYNYYYSLDKENGTDLRHDYLNSIQQSLNERAAQAQFKTLIGNPAMETAQTIINASKNSYSNIKTGIENGLGGIFFDSLDPDYIPISDEAIANSYISADMHEAGKVWGYVSDAASNIGNMLPSIAAGALSNAVIPGSGTVVQTTLMGLGAGGQAYQEAINSGYDKTSAREYGVANGLVETLLEKALGAFLPSIGVNKLNEKSRAVLNKFTKNLDNAFTAFLFKSVKTNIGEVPEEWIQEWLEPKIKNAILHSDDPEPAFFSEETLYAGLLGLTCGFILSSGDIAIDTRNSIDIGKRIKNTPEGISDLVKVGDTMPLDSAAHKILSKINAESSAYSVGQAFIEAGATVSEQNYKDIVDGLV